MRLYTTIGSRGHVLYNATKPHPSLLPEAVVCFQLENRNLRAVALPGDCERNLSSRRKALERHTRLDYRSPGEALSQGPGKEAKLCFVGHALMEKRNGLLVDICLTPADGHAEHV